MKWLACIAIAGCGSVSAKPDASSDGSMQQDAAPPACDLAKPFGIPIQVMGIHDPAGDDNHATLTADELTIFFASSRGGTTWHIYSATRASRTAAFGTPALVQGTYSAEGEAHPSVSPDGNTIYFDSFRVTMGTVHIFSSTRTSATVQFPAATMITGDYLTDPGVTADGKVLYAANLSSGGLVRMDRSGSSWTAPQAVSLPAASSVVSPVTNDDLTMFLSFGDTTGAEIGMTKRATTTVGFPMPTSVAELAASASVAEPSWLSADGCRLYLTYAMGTGKQTIFVATRPN